MNLLPKDQIHFEDRVSLPFPTPAVLLILLLLLMLLSLTGIGLNTFLGQIQGVDFQETYNSLSEESASAERNFIRLTVMINQFFMFTLPGLCFGFWMYRKNIWSFFSMDRFPKLYWVLLALIWIVASFPLIQFTFWLNQQMPLPSWAITMEDNTNSLISGIMQTENIFQLMLNLFIIAVLPGLGEELIFRGILQQHLAKAANSMTAGIWISSFLFSAMHMQFEGFLPRMMLGLMLAYLFYWTANLWLPIIAHLFYNGAQVLAYYMIGDPEQALKIGEADTVSWPLTIFSFIFVLVLAYHFRQSGRPPNNVKA
jgi:CAAX amino terminal protease family.